MPEWPERNGRQKKAPTKVGGGRSIYARANRGSLKEIIPSETTLVSSRKVFSVKQPPHRDGQTLDKPVCKFITRLQTLENAARPYVRNTKGEYRGGQSEVVGFNVKKGLRIAFVL